MSDDVLRAMSSVELLRRWLPELRSAIHPDRLPQLERCIGEVARIIALLK